jgi:hypothetical protein
MGIQQIKTYDSGNGARPSTRVTLAQTSQPRGQQGAVAADTAPADSPPVKLGIRGRIQAWLIPS